MIKLWTTVYPYVSPWLELFCTCMPMWFSADWRFSVYGCLSTVTLWFFWCVCVHSWRCLQTHTPRGGGAPPLWKVIGTCRWTGYVFAGHQYWHRVSNRPNVVITIGTGYQIGLMWSSPLTQGIKIGLRLSQDRVPIVFYNRPAIQAEAMTFFFLFLFFLC